MASKLVYHMYIVAIAWFYVVAMIAVVSDSWLKGIVRFIFLGVIPIAMLTWLMVRRRRAHLEKRAQDLTDRSERPEP